MADQYEGDGDPNLALYAKAGHVLYAHKATEGIAHHDAKYHERVRRAHELGLTVVHYHYCGGASPGRPVDDAGWFWAFVKPLYGPGDYLCLDFEVHRTIGDLTDAEYIQKLHAKLMGTSGHDALIYGSTSFLAENTARAWLKRRRVWQAQYGPNPKRALTGRPWWAWQSSDGNVGPDPHRLAGMPSCDVSVLRLDVALAGQARLFRRRRRARQVRR